MMLGLSAVMATSFQVVIWHWKMAASTCWLTWRASLVTLGSEWMMAIGLYPRGTWIMGLRSATLNEGLTGERTWVATTGLRSV